VLAGRPRPRIEDTVKIGELMRLAALAQFGWRLDEATRRRRPNAPSVISGRGDDNRPLRGGEHRHAFWLPEDADGDGEIDHVVVYAQAGFTADVRSKLDRLTGLWTEKVAQTGDDEDADLPTARREWRLALEGFGLPKDFRAASRLLGRSTIWESATPFLAAGHLKAGGYRAEIRRLALRRGLPLPVEVTTLRPEASPEPRAGGVVASGVNDVGVVVHGRLRRPIHFHRFRSRGRERQPDVIGTFVKVTFADPIEGPLALGYGCHFGLGLFASCVKELNHPCIQRRCDPC
jgi:CRISPR-associated protein Csb2